MGKQNKSIWFTGTPTEKGYYWCNQNGLNRVVKVWGYDNKLFTNEDGGATINDFMYNGAKWCSIDPPPPI